MAGFELGWGIGRGGGGGVGGAACFFFVGALSPFLSFTVQQRQTQSHLDTLLSILDSHPASQGSHSHVWARGALCSSPLCCTCAHASVPPSPLLIPPANPLRRIRRDLDCASTASDRRQRGRVSWARAQRRSISCRDTPVLLTRARACLQSQQATTATTMMLTSQRGVAAARLSARRPAVAAAPRGLVPAAAPALSTPRRLATTNASAPAPHRSRRTPSVRVHAGLFGGGAAKAAKAAAAAKSAAAYSLFSPDLAFTCATFAVVALYGVAVAAPLSRLSKALFLDRPFLIPSLLGVAYLALGWQAYNAGALSGLWDAARGCLPAPTPEALAAVFHDRAITALAWLHLLAVDLVSAAAVMRDGLATGTPIRHSVALCLMFGPIGLLSHAATRAGVAWWRRAKRSGGSGGDAVVRSPSPLV